ncbi:MAG: energy transducer TonB [Ignavibacteriaceae bacterium]
MQKNFWQTINSNKSQIKYLVMVYNSVKNVSVSVSVFVHVVIIALLLTIKLSVDYPPQHYVELSFGQSGLPGSSGAIGDQVNSSDQQIQQASVSDTKNKTEDIKSTEIPESKNLSNEDLISQSDKKNQKGKNDKNLDKKNPNSNFNSLGMGNKTGGNGSFGYDINWGGKGQRKIYSYNIPAYPEGVNKEIDIRLKFTILPDGTVGTIIPLIKADTRLENSAINSLRQWRFEALDPSQKQAAQIAVIVFPYRLR